MAQTKTVTGQAFTGVRTNEDGRKRLLVTVTYSDATTEKLELDITQANP
jgi:hypothetical protein